jgi:hypothetical protein
LTRVFWAENAEKNAVAVNEEEKEIPFGMTNKMQNSDECRPTLVNQRKKGKRVEHRPID